MYPAAPLAPPLAARAASTAPELLLFDESTVTAATKSVQRASEAPSAVTVITREGIRRYGYRTLVDPCARYAASTRPTTAATPSSACAASSGRATTTTGSSCS